MFSLFNFVPHHKRIFLKFHFHTPPCLQEKTVKYVNKCENLMHLTVLHITAV